MTHALPDLFEPPEQTVTTVKPWRPRPLTHEEWPPDYRGVFAWRIETLASLRANPRALLDADAYYRTRPAQWINDWCDTYNPRKQENKWMPFVFFKRQSDLIEFFEHLRMAGESGLIEKARDMGATWLACAYSVWCLRYIPEDSTGWGSRKQDLVDKLGDADSIFEKMRLIIRRLPIEFRPQWSTALMKIVNETNGSTITGESGDNIGRGGRKSRYFKDEAAHYERPELIEAALGDNTDVQIDISSVNGLGNVFHRRRESGEVWSPGAVIPKGIPRVFIMDWRDHPEKTQAWYDQRKAKAEREGMQHVFAQEVDRNYSAAVENTIIAYEWITASLDAHLHIPSLAAISNSEDWMAGLDVYDAGADKNALAIRQGFILRHARDWGDRDPGVATRTVLADLRERGLQGIELQYDPIGIGSAVKSEWNRLVEAGVIDPDEFRLVPWNAGAGVIRPFERVIPGDDNSPLNRDFYHNFKAQAWWALRTRFYKTWRARTQGELYEGHELISIDSTIPCLHQLMKELAQPTHGRSTASLRMLVQKSPPGTRSPNLGDATVQCFFPASAANGGLQVGSYSG
jgi:phage terminase large subunit